MADLTYTTESQAISHGHWGAIWSGTFTFIAIWAIFGMLGAAIFESRSNAGVNVGMVIWGVILTIIAMFFAGRVTSQLADPASSNRTPATIMFGLSFTAVLLLLLIVGNAVAMTRAAGASSTPYLASLVADLGWPLFIAMFLGWLAAMGGATTAHKELTHRALHQQPSHA